MQSSSSEQFPTPHLLLSSGLNSEVHGQLPFSRDSKEGILGGGYVMGDNNGGMNTGYGETNPSHSFENSDEYSRGGRGQRFAPMATINQAQEMNYSNFGQDSMFAQRGAEGGFQPGMPGNMSGTSPPTNAVGAMSMMNNPALGNTFSSQEAFMMGTGQPGEYQQH
ncbi:hypothetical protein K7432_013948 [Basidiobolus ranarum]|uniref:Uncharacterized protein n=1 Tax=Basidiobolus ranarum TaxID=34480 RepID=A0ABR2WID6_9FUNG